MKKYIVPMITVEYIIQDTNISSVTLCEICETDGYLPGEDLCAPTYGGTTTHLVLKNGYYHACAQFGPACGETK